MLGFFLCYTYLRVRIYVRVGFSTPHLIQSCRSNVSVLVRNTPALLQRLFWTGHRPGLLHCPSISTAGRLTIAEWPKIWKQKASIPRNTSHPPAWACKLLLLASLENGLFVPWPCFKMMVYYYTASETDATTSLTTYWVAHVLQYYFGPLFLFFSILKSGPRTKLAQRPTIG